MKYQIFKQKFSEMEGLNLRIREAMTYTDIDRHIYG
mgnify:CR=1 FL=1